MPPRLSIRLDLDAGRVGPGKVALLEAIAATGSIAAAGRTLAMSYRRAWELVADLNRALAAPVIETATGGPRGGGARLTPAGRALIERYRRIEREAAAAAAPDLRALTGE